jgi:L-lactate dehydrogenase
MGVASELALVNRSKDTAVGEMMDLMHGQAMMGKRCRIVADSDYSCTAGSRICVVTAGARQGPGESRLDLVQKNVGIFKSIIPQLVKYSPNCIILVVSNPVDLMTWVTWKLSGLPRHRVIGSGTSLDTSRFRHMLADRLGVAAHSVHGYIIGEHGDSSVAVWSSVNVSGTLLQEMCPTAGATDGSDPEDWAQCHTDVIRAAYKIIELKGYTNWGIGLMISRLCQIILRNQMSIITVSTLVEGWHNIQEEVFLSVPCVLGNNGITHIVNQTLSDAEKEKLMESVGTMKTVMDGIKF